MANSTETPNLLGEQIAKRLSQLGLSRREFSRRFNLSRQTLSSIEHGSGKRFAASTYEAIDKGMKWPNGTAKAYYEGLANAREVAGGQTVEQLVKAYVGSIIEHVYQMDLEQLEHEVLMIEEETYGRPLPESEDELKVINETVARLAKAMLKNGHVKPGKQVEDG